MDIKIWIAFDGLLAAIGLAVTTITSPIFGLLPNDLAVFVFGFIGLPIALLAVILGADLYAYVKTYGLD